MTFNLIEIRQNSFECIRQTNRRKHKKPNRRMRKTIDFFVVRYIPLRKYSRREQTWRVFDFSFLFEEKFATFVHWDFSVIMLVYACMLMLTQFFFIFRIYAILIISYIIRIDFCIVHLTFSVCPTLSVWNSPNRKYFSWIGFVFISKRNFSV